MTNYLGLMGIQQWQVRSDVVAKSQEAGTVKPKVVEEIVEEVDADSSLMPATHAEQQSVGSTTETEAVSEEAVSEEAVSEEAVSEEAVSEEVDQLVSEASQAIEEALQIATVATVQDEDDVPESEHESDFYVYAAVSLRQSDNEQQKWLWIVDQTSLSREELKLLDNIVTATDSEWAESGLADGYMGDGQLKDLLDDDLNEVVLFGSSHAEFFANRRVFVTFSITKLVDDADKKRQTWQGLKQLMQ